MRINNINGYNTVNNTPNFKGSEEKVIEIARENLGKLVDTAVKKSPKVTTVLNDAGEKVQAKKPLNLIEKGLVRFDLGHITRKPYQAVVSKLSQSNRAFTHLMVADSIILSTFYTINSLRNKKIDKKQKPQMVINDILTLGVSAGTSYFIEGGITKGINALQNKYLSKHCEYYIQQGEEIMKSESGFKKFKELGTAVANVIDQGQSGSEAAIKGIIEKIKLHAKDIKDNDAVTALKRGKDGKTRILKYPGLSKLKTTSEELQTVEESVKSIIENGIAKSLKKADIISNVEQATKGLYTKIAANGSVDVLSKGIGKLKTLIVFGLIYRYLGPVLVTPLANKISAKFFDKKDESNKSEQTQKK